MARYLSGSLVVDGATLNGGVSGTIAVTSQIPSTSKIVDVHPTFYTASMVKDYNTSMSANDFPNKINIGVAPVGDWVGISCMDSTLPWSGSNRAIGLSMPSGTYVGWMPSWNFSQGTTPKYC